MKIVLHTGVHFTDEDLLIRSLLRNATGFAARGITVPEPGRYRRLLRATLAAMQDAQPAPDAREILLDAMLDQEPAGRLILSSPHVFGVQKTAVRKGRLYPAAAERVASFRRLFPDDEIDLFMAIRNPATFLPKVHPFSARDAVSAMLLDDDPTMVAWGDVFRRLREAHPDIAITVWCNEDTPLIWGRILREMAGLQADDVIEGAFDLLATLISASGMEQFRAHLQANPGMSETDLQQTISSFIDRFASADSLEEEIDMPGWTDDLVSELTALYDRDFAALATIPGLRVIAP